MSILSFFKNKLTKPTAKIGEDTPEEVERYRQKLYQFCIDEINRLRYRKNFTSEMNDAAKIRAYKMAAYHIKDPLPGVSLHEFKLHACRIKGISKSHSDEGIKGFFKFTWLRGTKGKDNFNEIFDEKTKSLKK